jgi:serine/threonine-protein kinase
VASYATLSAIGRIGRYELLGRMAVGGMAEIYLARDSGPRAIQRHLVVKRVLPHVADDQEAVEMFVQEASLCVHLKHPNICPIYEFGEANGSFFLAMEWVRGVSLRDLIDVTRRDGGLPVAFVMQLFSDLAGALHHAHTARDQNGRPLGIVHRDVTPENIIVGFDGVVKLIDFGIAKADLGAAQKTEKGVLKGKFAYISPEQYQGKELDGRSDVFSLSVCLYEALAGKSLYERASEYETVAAIVLDPDIPNVRDSRRDVPQELEDIVRRGLAKDRDDRFRSADELQMRLQRLMASLGEVVRHADVASWLDALFPDKREVEPDLDRRPPTLPIQTESYKERRKSDFPDRMEQISASMEVELMEEEMRRRRRSRRILVGFLVLAGLAGLAAAAWWVLTRPPPPPQGESPSSAAGQLLG